MGFQLPLNNFQIANGAGSSEVEFVLAAAKVAGMSPLSPARVRLAVFDRHALAELLSASGCRGSLAQALLQKFVVGDLDGAATAGSRIRTVRPQRARTAGLGRELDLRTEDDGLLFAGWARDRAVTQVDRELTLAEVGAIAGEPGTADDGATARENLVDDPRVDVATIDVERIDRQPLRRDIRDPIWGGLFLGAIRRQHGTAKTSNVSRSIARWRW